MKNKITFTSPYDSEETTLVLFRASYPGGNTAITMETEDQEPWGVLSVNICPLPERQILIDSNNNSPQLIAAMVEANVIQISERKIRSGFCEYPVATITDKWWDIIPELQ